jgi:hypothetical protein
MDVQIANAWPTFVDEDVRSISLLCRTDKLMVAVATRQTYLDAGVTFQEDKVSFNLRLADELQIPQVIIDVLKETGDLKDED